MQCICIGFCSNFGSLSKACSPCSPVRLISRRYMHSFQYTYSYLTSPRECAIAMLERING